MGEHVQQLLEILDRSDRDCGRWSVGDRKSAFVDLAGAEQRIAGSQQLSSGGFSGRPQRLLALI